ncbi:amine oxidase catalytic domain-containing protein [Teratosphaeria nubilosa]|uniref:Amine oxidase n=1 Tax=Teratosphaeria nubilosa TaxID=161662 RepID=A0A6G1L0Y5_9PEZI|nr:amine oxidase catalytic domain-containing protein [Teratosphaeria nubilosa]
MKSYSEKHLATHRTTVQKAEFHAPRKNLWAELTEDEANDVNDFLSHELAYLNLTKRPTSARDNFIFIVETLKPNKTDATPYLYSNDHAKPARWAKAAVAQNFPNDGPYMVYYQVGPLPITNSSVIKPLTHIFNSGRHYVRNPIQDFSAIQDFALSMAENISDITQELLGAVANRENPQDPKGLLAFPRGSRVESGGLTMWMQLYRPGYGSGARTILPQGVYAKVDARSSDIEQWRVGEFYYNGVVYEDAAAFRKALRDPEFQRTPANLDGPWTETEDFDSRPESPTGVSLFDIRFKGERIMYELGLQEAMAHYAGDDPMQGGLEFMDSFFGMGKNAFELVPGYDCPAYADYLDLEWHQAYQTHKQPNSICIFEYTSDALLSRHTAQYSVTASRNTFFVVRSVSTVGNYDYTIDYIFYLDGSIEVKVRASGFIFGGFYTSNNTKSEDEYGHRIHDALSSSMHDHIINLKADMDVAGPANDMVRLAIEPITKSFEWDQPEAKERNTMHLVEYQVSHETGLEWPKNSGEFYLVYSATGKNAWGERKGYRITSGTGMGNTPHLTFLNSTTLGDSARWAEKDLWVVRRKDTEPRSADPLNYFAPHDPLIDFTKIADGESLAHDEEDDEYDGDLVVYFNIGAHHVPHAGDVPNTLMHTSASSVMFVPHNFHDRDPSRESAQGVRLQLAGTKSSSGGFAGEPAGEEEGVGDLRSRSRSSGGTRKGTQARYFGGTYREGVEVPLGMLGPDVRAYVSEEHGVTDLGFNGSAAGVCHREEALGGVGSGNPSIQWSGLDLSRDPSGYCHWPLDGGI